MAASIFVIMPPLPTPAEPAPPRDAVSIFEISVTKLICLAPGVFGLASYKPSISVINTNKSASTNLVTRAARPSLSPYLISSVPTVSFSLITGTTPSFRSELSTPLMFMT